MACQCPSNAHISCYDKYENYFDKCFTVKNTKSSCKTERSPHITQGLKNSIREKKNRLAKLAHKWPLTFKEHYRIYENKSTSLLKTANKKYNQDQHININIGGP